MKIMWIKTKYKKKKQINIVKKILANRMIKRNQ